MKFSFEYWIHPSVNKRVDSIGEIKQKPTEERNISRHTWHEMEAPQNHYIPKWDPADHECENDCKKGFTEIDFMTGVMFVFSPPFKGRRSICVVLLNHLCNFTVADNDGHQRGDEEKYKDSGVIDYFASFAEMYNGALHEHNLGQTQTL